MSLKTDKKNTKDKVECKPVVAQMASQADTQARDFWQLYDSHDTDKENEKRWQNEINKAWNAYSNDFRKKLIKARYYWYLEQTLPQMLIKAHYYSNIPYKKFLKANSIIEKEAYYLRLIRQIKSHRLSIFIMTHALSFGAHLAKAIETYQAAFNKIPILGLISAVFSLAWRTLFSLPVELGTSYDEHVNHEKNIGFVRLILSLMNTGISIAYLLTMSMVSVIVGTAAVAISFASAYAYIPAMAISIGIEFFRARKYKMCLNLLKEEKKEISDKFVQSSNLVELNELNERITALDNYIARSEAYYKFHIASAKIWGCSLGALSVVSVITTIVTLTIAGSASTLSCGIIPAVIGLAILVYTLYKISQKRKERDKTTVNEPVVLSNNKVTLFKTIDNRLIKLANGDNLATTSKVEDNKVTTAKLEALANKVPMCA